MHVIASMSVRVRARVHACWLAWVSEWVSEWVSQSASVRASARARAWISASSASGPALQATQQHGAAVSYSMWLPDQCPSNAYAPKCWPLLLRSSLLAQMDKRWMQLSPLSTQFWSSCHCTSVVLSMTQNARGPGSNPTLAKLFKTYFERYRRFIHQIFYLFKYEGLQEGPWLCQAKCVGPSQSKFNQQD